MRETDYAIDKLLKAWQKLQQGAQAAENELERDGVIQRFEFTVELFWKTLKIFLKHEGIEAKTPKDSLREAFRLGWLEEENVYLDMLDDRNLTSHIYEKGVVEQILQRVRARYVASIGTVLEQLKRKI
jgi:nucleotidyltransferase substrate binding protein (TIGR01987 family)